MKNFKSILIILIISFLTACVGDRVSWDTQEMQRAIAIENSEYNARAFRLKNKQFAGYAIVGRGDSTIDETCANGDGWASVDLVRDDGYRVPLKCSTASATKGCLTKEDFAQRKFASEENRCNIKLPVPMPKINK